MTSMTEDELLTGITDALTLGGWHWWHVRRSDRALLQGYPGWPDITAIRGLQLLVIECKTETGLVSPEQGDWIQVLRCAGIDARVVRPADYDALYPELVGERLMVVR